MEKPVKNNFARWIEGRVPPGLDWRTERSWVVWGLILGTLWSAIVFWSRLDNARDRLYDWVGGQRVLVESRTIDPFPELLDQAMAGFLLGMALTIPLACYHYAYHYLGSRSIYLMRRLPDRWDLWRRCLTVPVLLAVLCLVAIELLTILHFLMFLLLTPSSCLPTEPWRQLLYALGGGRV